MSLSIFEYGDGRFRLFHGGREVGWVEGRAVGFVGFDSEAAAVQAATAAYDALSSWLARQSREHATPRRRGRLGTRTDHGVRRLTLGGAAIGARSRARARTATAAAVSARPRLMARGRRRNLQNGREGATPSVGRTNRPGPDLGGGSRRPSTRGSAARGSRVQGGSHCRW